ncbi:hypothetical protein LP420_17610 [Massilia sp. B-10]|nr:hypothetical protein LP420_17610 [Massilia sp. B-10]
MSRIVGTILDVITRSTNSGKSMRFNNGKQLLPQCAVFLALTASNIGFAAEIDHREFEATLHVPYKAEGSALVAKSEARTFTLEFDYPYVAKAQNISWRVELLAPGGQVVKHWTGVQRLFKKPVEVKVRWAKPQRHHQHA